MQPKDINLKLFATKPIRFSNTCQKNLPSAVVLWLDYLTDYSYHLPLLLSCSDLIYSAVVLTKIISLYGLNAVKNRIILLKFHEVLQD
jgi:hypothetical protein